MKFSDLITDPGTGQMSGTKLWGHIANTVVTTVVLFQAYQGNLEETTMMFYMGFVGSSAVASKYISMKFGSKETQHVPQSL